MQESRVPPEGPFFSARQVKSLFPSGVQWLNACFACLSGAPYCLTFLPDVRKACFTNGFPRISIIHAGIRPGGFSDKPEMHVFPMDLQGFRGWVFLVGSRISTCFPNHKACYMEAGMHFIECIIFVIIPGIL